MLPTLEPTASPTLSPTSFASVPASEAIASSAVASEATASDAILSLYGDRLFSHGLSPPALGQGSGHGEIKSGPDDSSTCRRYWHLVPDSGARSVGVAGLFNTGTNFLYTLLSKNCVFPGNPGTRWQVSWGKHNPPEWRTRHSEKSEVGTDQESVLPVVVIKDPLTWIVSMCRNPYAARWKRGPDIPCPSLVHLDDHTKTYEVDVAFKKDRHSQYSSLVDFWNTWYLSWFDQTFPFLMVRYEDLLFRPEKVIGGICRCGGGVMNEEFHTVEESAKNRSNAYGHSDAMARYGNATKRTEKFTTVDRRYFDGAVDGGLMEMFHYERSGGGGRLRQVDSEGKYYRLTSEWSDFRRVPETSSK